MRTGSLRSRKPVALMSPRRKRGAGGALVMTTSSSHFEVFGPKPPSLTVSKTGTGSGTVTSDVAGVECGLDCAQSFGSGTVVTLSATPDAGSTFRGWGGDCGGTAPTAQVALTGDRTCTAVFTQGSQLLTVTKAGSGTGLVASIGSGIACGVDCAESYPQGTVVTLTATPDAGSTFAGWGGDCKGMTLTVKSGDRTVKLHTSAPELIQFITHTPDLSGEITCGPINPAKQVVVTYRTSTDAKSPFDGEPVAVEFVKPDEK